MYTTNFNTFMNDLISMVEKDFNITTKKIKKVNVTKTGLMLSNHSFTPTIYVEDIYSMSDGNIISGYQAVCKILSDFNNTSINLDEVTKITNSKDEILKHVTFKMVNYNMNKELSGSHPHRTKLDFIILYRVVFDDTTTEQKSFTVTNELADKLYITEEELYQAAYNNMEKATIKSIAEYLNDTCPGMVPPEFETPLYFVTNDSKHYGANYILSGETMKKVYDMFGEPFYILPSSIHEILVIPVSKGSSALELANMVKIVNESELKPDEILSNNVYLYDGKKVTICK